MARRSGFTLIELLVVIAIIAVLIALLVPAVQKVRESSNRTTCQNQLKQISLAVHSFHDAYRFLPPSHIGDPGGATGRALFPNGDRHCFVFLLPYIEQQDVYALYDFGTSSTIRHWYNSTGNNLNASKTPLKIFQCPTADNPRFVTDIQGSGAAASDYNLIFSVNLDPSLVPFTVSKVEGLLSANAMAKTKSVTDGLSNTILFVEIAGRPDSFTVKGRQTGSRPNAAWANPKGRMDLDGASADGATIGGSCSINCTNNAEIFSFHSGGANISFGDGAVRFIAQDISIGNLCALVTRANEDPVPGDLLQ